MRTKRTATEKITGGRELDGVSTALQKLASMPLRIRLSRASVLDKRHRDPFGPGQTPGTLVVPADAVQTRIQVIGYGLNGAEALTSCETSDLQALLSRHPSIWVNVDGLADVALIQTLGDAFKLSRLALEDVLSGTQRPKVEIHDDYEFAIVRRTFLRDGDFTSEQVAVFFGRGFVVSFHERSSEYLEPVRDRLMRGSGKIRKAGSDYLTYAVVDCVIDHYFPVLSDFAQRLEALDEEIFHECGHDFPTKVRQLRADLQTFLRLAMPVRDVLNKLITDTGSRVTAGTKPYLRDCLDHILQVIDQLGGFRHASTDLMNHYHAHQTQKLNETMKVLTMIATIFIPLTFITSVYGMNFEVMPELHWRYGYAGVVLGMAVIAGAMLYYFQRKGWIGGQPGRTEQMRRRGEHGGR